MNQQKRQQIRRTRGQGQEHSTDNLSIAIVHKLNYPKEAYKSDSLFDGGLPALFLFKLWSRSRIPHYKPAYSSHSFSSLSGGNSLGSKPSMSFMSNSLFVAINLKMTARWKCSRCHVSISDIFFKSQGHSWGHKFKVKGNWHQKFFGNWALKLHTILQIPCPGPRPWLRPFPGQPGLLQECWASAWHLQLKRKTKTATVSCDSTFIKHATVMVKTHHLTWTSCWEGDLSNSLLSHPSEGFLERLSLFYVFIVSHRTLCEHWLFWPIGGGSILFLIPSTPAAMVTAVLR